VTAAVEGRDAPRTTELARHIHARRLPAVLRRPAWLGLLLVVAALAYVTDLGGSSIWDANEAFYVETPREMVERGDYVNPTFNYEPRFNKPVLPYWIVAGLYQLFGVSVATQRAAIAGFALVMLLAVFVLARAASVAPAAPLLAVLGLAANPRFFMFSRRILIDIALASLMTLVLLFFALAERYPARRRMLLAAMYGCVGLGVLTKGPVAAVLPALAFLVYLALHGELRRLRDMMIPQGIALALAIAAPWYVALYLQGGWTHIAEFFIGENLERFTELVGPQQRGVLFYLPVVFSDGLPWSLCLPAAAAVWWTDRRAPRLSPDLRIRTLLLVWTATIVAVFSLSETKQDLYIFPIVAAVTVLGADVVARGAARLHDLAFRWVRAALLAGGVALGLLGVAALYLFARAETVYVLEGSRLAGLLALAGGGTVSVLAARRHVALAAVAILAVLVAFNWVLVLRVLPGVERYKPVVALSDEIRSRTSAADIVVHYDVSYPSMVFYLQRHVDVLFDRQMFVDLVRSDRRVYAVLPADRYAELDGDIGAVTCELDRRPTFDAKLREVLSLEQPPAVVLVTNRCAPGAAH
jgi:4-amino-4-deoxy-L-arabinose transferase-like glycosyltransferase